MGVNAGATAVIVVMSFVITVLLGFGAFGMQWVTDERGQLCEVLDNKAECCGKGYIHSCTDYMGLNFLNSSIYYMVLAAFIMVIVVTVLFFMGGWCWCSNFRLSDFAWCKPLRCHRWFGTLGGYVILIYPLAGALSFTGCMLILSEFKGAPFGHSLYLCVAGSSLLLVASIALILYICRQRSQYISELRSRTYGGAGQQTSRGTECVLCLKSVNVSLLAGDVSDAEDDDAFDF